MDRNGGCTINDATRAARGVVHLSHYSIYPYLQDFSTYYLEHYRREAAKRLIPNRGLPVGVSSREFGVGASQAP